VTSITIWCGSAGGVSVTSNTPSYGDRISIIHRWTISSPRGSMTKFSGDVRKYIEVRPRENYLGSKMPSKHDDQLSVQVDSLRSEGNYASAEAVLRGIKTNLLPAFAQRMSVLAVREKDRNRILSGLRAVVLASMINPERELVIPLSLLWNSAVLIGQSPENLFDEVRSESGVYGTLLSSFATRIPSDRSIAAMGYSAAGEGKSFLYVCDWVTLK
jgi:hypothetical protein